MRPECADVIVALVYLSETERSYRNAVERVAKLRRAAREETPRPDEPPSDVSETSVAGDLAASKVGSAEGVAHVP